MSATSKRNRAIRDGHKPVMGEDPAIVGPDHSMAGAVDEFAVVDEGAFANIPVEDSNAS
jgi:hypothetical protein